MVSLKATWRLIRPFWSSQERWKALALLTGAIASHVGLTMVGVGFNLTSGRMFNAIQDHDLNGFLIQLVRWGGLFAVLLVVVAGGYYVTQLLSWHWRGWMTRHLLDRWMLHHAFLRLPLLGQGGDNPDQRIAEDVALFVDKSLDLGLGIVHAVLGIGAFATILWGLSENFDLFGFRLPGLLLWAAILYSLIGTAISHLAGKTLPSWDVDLQKAEADFRFSLVRVRENASGIAMMDGAGAEALRLKDAFALVLGRWLGVIRRKTGLVLVSRAFGQLSTNVAYLIMAPRYFAGGLPLGSLVQGSSAFQQIDVSLNWIIQNYSDISLWRSAARRLCEFDEAMSRANGQMQGISRQSTTGDQIGVEGLGLNLPDGRPLLRSFDLDVEKGRRLLVTGPSGCGKSTLFQALAGHWLHGKGQISLPQEARLMFLPQRPYLPIASLRTAATYPVDPMVIGEERLIALLHHCRLAHLIPALDEAGHWQQRLSPGELQRLGFMRALLIRPDFLFLDEATSALDRETEAALYDLLLAELPDTAIVSIGHRQSLNGWHHQHLDLATQTLSPL